MAESSSISKNGGEDLSKVFEVGRQGQTVHIFSIASGFLYERFLKTMILTVLKNTQRPVKFWFLDTYLSPKFKNILPLMAQVYHFQYEFIGYKWPSWLYQHKEKKQLIWGYKFLFLDVLFPLSVKKAIFIAADVIVRADVGELYDMDLNNKPLACTPICNNNRDMDSYRFWKQDFWRSHLQGKPYYSSALYVVDLVKFRQMTAADTLRTFHERINKDANNLSRPDQDLLVNYAQHSVPIFSLPQEWVWSEPWCEDADKTKAKTIYLCKNPIMKEAKPEVASRIIPDWDELNAEAGRFE